MDFHETVWPLARFRERHAASIADVRSFWEPIGRSAVRWRKPYTRVLDWDPPFAHWFPDGTLNVSENCLDRHMETSVADRVAYLWEGEPGDRRKITYRELWADVARLAGSLRDLGLTPRDVAAVYLPMIPELPKVMLALARLGVPFTAVFSGFSAEALSARIRATGAKFVFTADGSYRRGKIVPLKQIVDDAVQGCASVERTIVVRRTGEATSGHPRDTEFPDLIQGAGPTAEPVERASTDPLFFLYSSGTTGSPKAISHGTGGYLVYAATSMRWVFDPQLDDTYFCTADVGWITGHTYVVFAPLLLGLTSVLFEGALDYPNPGRLWELVERYHVSILYTSPTALRSFRRQDSEGPRRHDLRSLRLLGTVGESINPDVWRWYFDAVGSGRCPIVDTWWQTETGGIAVSGVPGLELVPMKPGSAGFPLPGVDFGVVDEAGRPAEVGAKGFAVIRQPWPGMLQTLHGDEARYRSVYWERFPGLYYTGDYAVVDSDGYIWFLGRADEVLKVAGHRLGTIEIEDALLSYPGVAEAAVCGRSDPIKGEVPVAFVVLSAGVKRSDALAAQLADQVQSRIGSIARPQALVFVGALPKTRSGKIMRRVVKVVADGIADPGDLSTLEDGASVAEIRGALNHLRASMVDPDA